MPSMISIYLLPDYPKGRFTVWATVFSVAQTVKTVAQIVSPPWVTVKSDRRNRLFFTHTVKLI